MGGYLSSRKLTNVRGRIKYITNERKQENIVDYYNSIDNEFWKMLAEESQIRFSEVNPGGKCCEAREFIIGIPQNSNVTAKQICDRFKNMYGVECTCAIHQNNKKGIVNRHCHLIFSERKKLEYPEIVEQKVATRNYYYNSKGKKCKKAEATKIVKKGTILQEGKSRYFTDKNDFFKTPKFVYDCKKVFLKDMFEIDWSLEGEKRNKELSEKHIGKNNPKEEYIKQNNKLKSIVKNVCNASDFVLDQEEGKSLKQLKEWYNIKSFRTENYEENENKVYNFVEEMQSVYKDRVKSEVKKHNMVNNDVYFLQQEDYIYTPIQENILSNYEPQTKTRSKPKVIEYLREKLTNMVKRIEKLIKIQDLLYIEPKNKIEVYQDKRNNNFHIEDNNYQKNRHHKDKDYGLEL